MSFLNKLSDALAPLHDKFDSWWQERNGRERIMLKIATPVCLIILLYNFAWAPFMASMDDNTAANPQLEQNWPQILELAGRLQELRNAGYNLENITPPNKTNILEQFKAAGLANTSNQFKFSYDQGSATISIKAASFDHLIQVLEQ